MYAAIFAKVAAAGTSVSLNNNEFAGSGEMVPLEAEARRMLNGTVTLSALPENTPIILASAAYDEGKTLLGGIGHSSVPVLTAHPLPRALEWSYLARAAAQLDVPAVSRRAAAEVIAQFVEMGAPAERWEQSPMLCWRLASPRVAHSAPAELRAAAQALLLDARQRALAEGSASGGLRKQIEALRRAQLQVMAVQLALAASDPALAATAVQASFNTLAPLLRETQRSPVLVQPIACCLAALSLLPREAFASVDRAAMVAHLGFEGARLAAEWRLPGLVGQLPQVAKSVLAAPDETAAPTGMGASEDGGAEALVRSLFEEWLASQQGGSTAAEEVAGVEQPAVRIARALAKSADSAAAIVAEMAQEAPDRGQMLRFAVMISERRLNESPSKETGEMVVEAVRSAAEAARRFCLFAPLSESTAAARASLAVSAAADEQEEVGAEAAKAALRASTLASLLCAAWRFVKERRTARRERAACLPWLAQARLTLARCAAIAFDSNSGGADAAAEGQQAADAGEGGEGGENDAVRRVFGEFDKDGSGLIDVLELKPALLLLGIEADYGETRAVLTRYDADGGGTLDVTEFAALVAELQQGKAPDPKLSEGTDVLVECSRCATLALRAQCPVLLLKAAVMLLNFHATLPAGALVASAFEGFEEYPRPKGEPNPPDKPPALPPAAWKPLVRAAEAVLHLASAMRDGKPLAGADPTSRGLAAASPLTEAERPDDESSVAETLALGPRRWFEERDASGDTTSLDFGWMLGLARAALRSTQLARVWRRQEALMLHADAVTDGRFSAALLPFLAQAQQKLHASKWADGEPVAVVAQRAEHAKSCKTPGEAALAACRRRRHEAIPPGTAPGELPEADVMGALLRSYGECASLCRQREDGALVEALVEMGELRLRSGQPKQAIEAWRQALDSTFGTLDVVSSWRDALATARDLGVAQRGRALALCSAMALHSPRRQLGARLDCALFAASLSLSLYGGAVAHPVRAVDFAGYRVRELWAGSEAFEPYAFTTLRLLDGLQGAVVALLEYGMALQALPLIALYMHIASGVCRDSEHYLAAQTLAIEACAEAGQIHHAMRGLAAAYRGTNRPVGALQPTGASKPEEPLAYACHEPPSSAANSLAIETVLELVPASDAVELADVLLLTRLDLARVGTLLCVSEHGGAACGGAAPDLLAACEEKLNAVTQALAETTDAGSGEDAARSEAAASIACRSRALRARLQRQRGLLSSVVSELAEAMATAQAAAAVAQPTSSFSVPPYVQLSPSRWLGLRLELAEAALAQGQLEACDDQLALGATEAEAARDTVATRRISLTRSMLLAARGEPQPAVSDLEKWLASTSSDDEASLRESAAAAAHLSALKLTIGGLSGGLTVGAAARASVVLLRRAVDLLSTSAVDHGMLSTERWPCLEQAVPPGQSGAVDALPSLRNCYSPLLSPLLEARVALAEALATAHATAGPSAEATAELGLAESLLPFLLHPRPSVVGRLHALRGRQARQRAQSTVDGGWLTAAWGGEVTAEADLAADPPEYDATGEAAEARRHLLVALAAQREGQVGEEQQAAVLLELALLFGAKLAPEAEAAHINAAAACVLAAEASSRARRAILEQLPALPAAPLTEALPPPIADLLGVAASDAEASRTLLHLLATMTREREMPRSDAAGHERLLHTLRSHLTSVHPPFAQALPATVPPLPDLKPVLKPGFVCVQWHVATDERTSMLFVLHRPSEIGDGAVVGGLPLPAGALFATREALARAVLELEEAATLPASRPPSLADAPAAATAAAIGSVAKLLCTARGAEPPPPSQPLAKEEADGGGGDGERRGAPPLGTEAVTRLAALFDGRMGGSVEDERICGWLRPLLGVV